MDDNKPDSRGLLYTALFAFGLLSLSFLSKLHAPRQDSESSGYPQDTNTNEREQARNGPVNIVIERIPPPTPNTEARENRKERRDQINTGIQGAIAFFACAYATVACFQWRAQLTAIRTDQRALPSIEPHPGGVSVLDSRR
jgi:hypothetical protein